MSTKIGVGHNELTDSRAAGSAAARMAMESGNLERADLVLLSANTRAEAYFATPTWCIRGKPRTCRWPNLG